MKITVPKKITVDTLLFGMVVACIFSFKIVLGGVGDAGLRPDDILIAIAFVLLFARGDLARVRMSRSLKLYLGFVAVCVLSSLWNGLRGRVVTLYSLLFDIRLLQYVVFYFLGYVLTMKGKSFRRTFTVYFYILVVVVPLQMVDIVPTASAFGSERASGNTNGPYELAVVACFLLAYLGYMGRSFVKGIGALFLLVLTASRVTLIGAIVSFCSAALRLGRRSLPMLVGSTALVILIVSATLIVSVNGAALADSKIELLHRLGSAATSSGTQTFLEDYRTARVSTTAEDYYTGDFGNVCKFNTCEASQGDKSGNIRYFHWAALLKSTFDSIDSTLIGLGPSFASTAVDGYYVRALAETGFVGMFMFLLSMSAFWRRDQKPYWALREYVLMLLITGVFIDIFTSYKSMILLWLWHGINQAKSALPDADVKSAEHDDVRGTLPFDEDRFPRTRPFPADAAPGARSNA